MLSTLLETHFISFSRSTDTVNDSYCNYMQVTMCAKAGCTDMEILGRYLK